MSIFLCSAVLFMMVVACTAQTADPFDDAHKCELRRKCKDCWAEEYCVKLSNTWLQRWWVPCPPWAPYCNPYSQRCEATIHPICQTLG